MNESTRVSGEEIQCSQSLFHGWRVGLPVLRINPVRKSTPTAKKVTSE